MFGNYPESEDEEIKGPSIVAYNLFKEMSKYYDVEFYSLKRGRKNCNSTEKKVHFLSSFELFRRLLYNKYDLLHVTNAIGRTYFIIKLARFFKRFKMLYTANGSAKTEAEHGMCPRPFISVLAEKGMVLSSNHVVCVSELLKNREIEHYGIDEKKVSVIGSGIDIEEMQKESLNKKKEGDTKKSMKRILTVGTAIVKNIDGLIEEFLKINRDDVELYIIGGENENIREIKSKFAKNNNMSRVKFTGAISHKEVLQYYKNGDIYVQASFWDAYPIAVLEALAFGLPVIVTDRVGTCSIIENGTNGLVVKHDEKGAIRKAIEKLLDSEELRRKLGTNGYELAKRQSWGKVGKEYKKIYDELI